MLESLKMTPFGAFHTVIGFVAVIAGLVALVRYFEITPRSLAGKIYIAATILTCLTGFGIFHHGGFGKPHVLGIITLVVLGVGLVAARSNLFGRLSRHVETVSFSMTFFFHMIPTVNETATRFPLGAPLAADAESPGLQVAAGVLFVLCLIGVFLQLRRLRVAKLRQTMDDWTPGGEQLSQ
jgi:uncharacterized membrane protein